MSSTGVTKGLAYGGVIYLPRHHFADCNGLVRFCMRTRSTLRVTEALLSLGIDRGPALVSAGIIRPTHSAVEQMLTEQAYGRILVAPLALAYANWRCYEELGREFFQQHKEVPACPDSNSKSTKTASSTR